MILRYADHDEVYQAGDAYYGRPGHLPGSGALCVNRGTGVRWLLRCADAPCQVYR